MEHPVRLELFKDGIAYEDFITENGDDLHCRIEMLTGVGWLDAEPLYHKLIASRHDHMTDTFRVCHSYEKWGDLQQEAVEVKLKMYRIKAQSSARL